MSATALTVHQMSDTPFTDPADVPTDAVNGNIFANSGATMIRVNNTAGATGTITFAPADNTLGPENLTVAGEAIPIPASTVQWIGRRDIGTFGRVTKFTVSAATLHVTIFEP